MALHKKDKVLEIMNSTLSNISFVVTYGPLENQVIQYTDIRYDPLTDILYYNYSFDRIVQVVDGFNFEEYLTTLLKEYLAFKE